VKWIQNLVGQPERGIPLGIPRDRWQGNIRIKVGKRSSGEN
jgi:hypothetical protein